MRLITKELMGQVELYDEVVLAFPASWPASPDWTWVNVHDGQRPKLDTLTDLVSGTINSAMVIVLIHSDPGIAIKLPIERTVEFMAEAILKHEIQVSDLDFTKFLSISRHGLATHHC